MGDTSCDIAAFTAVLIDSCVVAFVADVPASCIVQVVSLELYELAQSVAHYIMCQYALIV